MRTVAIWVCGLLACAIIGGLIGSGLAPPYTYDWGVWGALAGMLAFACLRLWLGGLVPFGPDARIKQSIKSKESAPLQQQPKNETSAEANELLIRRRQAALFLADIAGTVMGVQLGTAKRLSTKPITGVAEPIAAFGCGLLVKALELSGIEFSERSLGSDGPFLILVQFVRKWLPDYSDDYDELARFVALSGAEEKYEKYLKCGQAAFLRYGLHPVWMTRS